MRTVERSRDRSELVREAGMGKISLLSALAGVLVAYGAVLVLLAVAAGIGSALGFETSGLSDNEWRDLGVGAAVALGVVLFGSYFFGGYVAGRMGRRAGFTHGLLVFVLGLVVVAAVAGITSATADGDAISQELQNQGIPTAAEDWRDIGLIGGAAILAAMLVGSLLGGVKGERWHGVLVTRALDPDVRPRGVDDVAQPERIDGAGTTDHRDDDQTVAVPAAGTGDDTASSPVVHRDERLPASVADQADGGDDRHQGTIDLTEAEGTDAARQDVGRERTEQASLDDEREQTRISRLQ